MLTSLSLENFRGFAQLDFPRLARVNLIGGVNNVGKTAVLEAIYLFLERNSQRIDALPTLFRTSIGMDDLQYFWRWLPRNADPHREFSITARVPAFGLVRHTCPERFSAEQLATNPAFAAMVARIPKGRDGRSLIVEDEQFDPAKPPVWPHVEALSPGSSSPVDDAQSYTKATRRKSTNEERMEAMLREIEPRLVKIRNYPNEATLKPLLHADLGIAEALPATQLGQGFNRVLRIYSAILSAEARIFLIDEIENGLHHSALEILWKGLASLARQEDVQIFATTHSREAILAAHRVFSAAPEYDFAYHRLERNAEGMVHAVTYDQEALTGADEANFEVR